MNMRECEFCTREAALACKDPVCRRLGYGETHPYSYSEVAELRTRLQRIARWHCRDSADGDSTEEFCAECGDFWPCDTYLMAKEGRLREPSCNLPAVKSGEREQVHTLTLAAKEIHARCAEAFPDADREIQQAMCLAEEVGEFIGAFRRWKGLARRTGPREDMAEELADVVIAAFVTAAALDIDLDQEIAKKLTKILSRGWRETA